MKLRSILVSLSLLVACSAAATDPGPGFASGTIVLLQPDWEIGERTIGGADALANYIEALFAAAEQEASEHAAVVPTSGVLVVAVRPGGRSRIWIEYGDNPQPEAMSSALLTRLHEVPAVPISEGTISFLVNFDLWGGGKPLTSRERPVFAPLPWREAAGRLGGSADTESIIDELWPPGEASE
jgi:hypothetical protein